MKIGKKQKEARKVLEVEKKYTMEQALELVKKTSTTKFDSTVDVAVRLGVDAKQSDQQVRGSVVLPHGSGKSKKVLAIVKGDKENEARDAGADYIWADDFVEKITGGWMDFEAVVATPDMMAVVARIGKVLGPRGLMPNPKLGTVTFDIKKAITEIKAGKAEFRTEKAGIVHTSIGKVSFDAVKLKDNLMALLETVRRLKPNTSKGVYYKSITLTTTMGPGVKIDLNDLPKALVA
jgi:large subunit ribosomal protein L1